MSTRRQAFVVVPLLICTVVSAFGVLGYVLGAAIGLPPRLCLPLLLRGVGIVVLILGFLLLGWVLRYRKPADVIVSTYLTIRKAVKGAQLENANARREPLILCGPQRYVRHPMYLAVVLLLLGWWLTLDCTPLLFMTVLLFLWYNLVVIPFEEKELRALYGEEYETYARTVPRFFPTWKRRVK